MNGGGGRPPPEPMLDPGLDTTRPNCGCMEISAAPIRLQVCVECNIGRV